MEQFKNNQFFALNEKELTNIFGGKTVTVRIYYDEIGVKKWEIIIK
ncbi:MAG: hypothetical protein PWQ17_805 [Anaerophaga sp.]|jgi:hypothetical protein|nr:hypothetical protein [Proteiniphilum sp.]MDK2841300.1 hypothetical protein [Anaerophaga sp.]